MGHSNGRQGVVRQVKREVRNREGEVRQKRNNKKSRKYSRQRFMYIQLALWNEGRRTREKKWHCSRPIFTRASNRTRVKLTHIYDVLLYIIYIPIFV